MGDWTFLRNELTSNNLRDFGLRKGVEYLGEVRAKSRINNLREVSRKGLAADGSFGPLGWTSEGGGTEVTISRRQERPYLLPGGVGRPVRTRARRIHGVPIWVPNNAAAISVLRNILAVLRPVQSEIRPR